MPPVVATVIYVLGILILFLLGGDSKRRTSASLWLPIAWLLISGSRPLSSWLQTGAGTSSDQLLEGSPLDRNFYLFLQVAGVIVLLGRRTTVLRFLRSNSPILLFAFYCAVSVSWSDYPSVAFKRWIKLLGDFTMVLIVLTARDRSHAVKRVLNTVGFILIPLSILLIKYYPDMSRYYDAWTGRAFVSGVGADKNMLGMTCLVYGFGALWQFLAAYRDKKSGDRTRRLIAHGAVLAMVFWLFKAADSMTSLSCFIMGGVVIAVTSFVKIARRPAIVHLLVAAVVGTAFSVLFLHVGEGAALESMGRNPTLTGRTELWATILNFSGNPLLGTGFDSFWLGKRLENIWATGSLLKGVNEAHNGYLETYLNLGWIGVTLLAALIVTGYRNVVATLRLDPDVGRLRLGFFVIAVVYSFTEVGFRTTCSVWIAFLLAMMAVPNAPVLKRSCPPDTGNVAGSESEMGLIVESHQTDQSLVAG